MQRLNHYRMQPLPYHCKLKANCNAQERGIRGRKAGSHLSSTTPFVDTLPCLSRRDDTMTKTAQHHPTLFTPIDPTAKLRKTKKQLRQYFVIDDPVGRRIPPELPY